jgi:hypothetical protein
MIMKKGDLVTIVDGSFAVRVDKFEESGSLYGNHPDIFEVVLVIESNLEDNFDDTVHDVFIKNKSTGATYLHSIANMKQYVEVKEKMYCEYCGKKLD